MKIQKLLPVFIILAVSLPQISLAQNKGKAKIALVQASAQRNQDPFLGDYDPEKVRPSMEYNFQNVLNLFDKAGQMGADLVCGPEDIQNIGSYGLYIDRKDPVTGKILFNSLAVKVPGPFTDKIAAIARKHSMYIIAPLYEDTVGKIFNTSVIFDRRGNIIGKHRKTLLPIMETWLVSTGNKYEVYQTDFASFAVATCWEISYPEIPTIYAIKGADIIFNPTMARDNKPGESLSTAPMFITRAKDNSVYVAPVVLGTEGNGIIDFDGNVIAESLGEENTVIMAEIDFSRERTYDSRWWKTINGTNNTRAMMMKSRRPDIFGALTDPDPPVLDRYRNIHLTTGDTTRQLNAVREVDYGPDAINAPKNSDLYLLGVNAIPYPRMVKSGGEKFLLDGNLSIVLDKNAGPADRFAADELINDLMSRWNIKAQIGNGDKGSAVILTHRQVPKIIPDQGYQLITSKDKIIIRANSEAGLFYGTRTFLQLIIREAGSFSVPGVTITDWPDIKARAVHYDTKHHQDKASYVKSFIKELADYKVNLLVWEWEDKFVYPSHPEIGAPGAFTMEEMQEFTRYARQYHIQIVPLVQGLGHVSFILKWPQYKHLRELEASNWEFCPLKQGSYDLLFDLWNDAIRATPGSEYIHIGSDETYELGACNQCKAKMEETGRSGLYQLFINKSSSWLQSRGRKVMAWETPMGWKIGDSPAKGIEPVKNLILTESYDYETPDLKYIKEAKSLGYKVFAYDPNPGVVPMMVPYIFEKSENGEERPGSLEKSGRFLSHAAKSGTFDGMICTSWDDDDLHNQMWMMHFINAAAWSWNGSAPSPEEFRDSFFKNYYGNMGSDMAELFTLLNEGVYYFSGTMERNVWHYGEIGQTHLPDLPRGDALEYDPYWNTEYKAKVSQSREMLIRMNRALKIIEDNKKAGADHSYDFELFRTTAELVKHTCLTYIDLSNLEYAIREAHVNRFVDYNVSLNCLIKAQDIVENILKRRESVFGDLVKTYEETRLPKGFSTPGKTFFWQQDRARHFAFRRPDMSFLIYDEQLLDMEGYLEKLKEYIGFFKMNSMK
jgi:predicted amidohydrolase